MRSSRAVAILNVWVSVACCPVLFLGALSLSSSTASKRPTTGRTIPSNIPTQSTIHGEISSRHDFCASLVVGGLTFGSVWSSSLSSPALAVADCFDDCLKNCKKVAPKDPEYCIENCKDYCEQEDRTDGLSGSVSAETGEVGLLGGTFGQGTVTKGEDKPPAIKIPGLDFTTEKGKKLIGY